MQYTDGVCRVCSILMECVVCVYTDGVCCVCSILMECVVY